MLVCFSLFQPEKRVCAFMAWAFDETATCGDEDKIINAIAELVVSVG